MRFAAPASAMLLALACFGPLPARVAAAEVGAAGAATPVGFADIVASVKPAVIAVTVRIEEVAQAANADESDEQGPSSQPQPFSESSPLRRFFFGSPEQQQQSPPVHQAEMALGSGFFISPDGYAVTNDHVVEHGASFKVATEDGTTYTARVVGADLRTDLALLKVDGRNDFPYVKLADHEPRIGDWVIAVGNPFGLGGSVTAGIISARGRHIATDSFDDFIQIDAPINRGNSGGPSFDVAGNVVGVNTAIYSPSGGSVGIGFAIPATTVKAVVDQLRQKGVVTRGSLGVEIQPVTPDIASALGLGEVTGALVSEAQPGGAAAKAGIAPGDVITSVDGKPIRNANDLAARIGTTAPGTVVKIGTRRDGNDNTVSVTLGELPVTPFKAAATPPEGQGLGLGLAPAATVEGAGSKGVVVTEVDPNGRAAEKGLSAGDVILDIGGKPVGTAADVRHAIGEAQRSGKHDILMRVETTDHRYRFVAVSITAQHQTFWGRLRSWIHSL
jgi:serine protease Do